MLVRIPLAAAPAAAASPALTKFTETLPIPGAINLTGGGSQSLALASAGSHQFHASSVRRRPSAMAAPTTSGRRFW